MVVPHTVFLEFLDREDPEDKENVCLAKYKQWHCKQFTEDNKNIKWCPAKDCKYVIERSDYALRKIVQCRCGESFCFNCGKEDHIPADCNTALMWDEKNQSDSENVTWIKANTKLCTKCNTNIEKNQGCNHMTCSRCKHEFCWLCTKDWKNHNNCNYDKDVLAQQKDQEQSKNQLQRYMHHFERF